MSLFYFTAIIPTSTLPSPPPSNTPSPCRPVLPCLQDVSLLMDGPVCKCRGHTIYFYYPASGVYCSFLNGCLSPEKYYVFHSGVKLPFVFAMRLQSAFSDGHEDNLRFIIRSYIEYTTCKWEIDINQFEKQILKLQ